MEYHDSSLGVRYVALSVLQMLRPHRVAGASKVRVGRFFDGGYAMLDRFTGVSAAYSLGINDDVSWDLDMARRGIPVFQYDHTIERLPGEHPLFHWEKICIGGQVDESAGVATIESLIKKNGHERADDMILKCDIEGAEWLALRTTPVSVLRQFRQIVLEVHGFHMLADPQHAENIRTSILNLTASHRVVHVHANNFAPWAIVGGMPVPCVLEFTLARIDEGEFSVSDEVFPTALDMPCYSERADYYLGRFEYA